MTKTFSKKTVESTTVTVLTVPDNINYRIDSLSVSGNGFGGSLVLQINYGGDNEPTKWDFTISPNNAVCITEHITIPAGGSLTITSAHEGIVVTCSVLTIPIEG